MRLSSFKTEYSFNKWFKKNRKKFAFTWFNYRIAEDPVEICRLTDGNKTVGLVVYNWPNERETEVDEEEILDGTEYLLLKTLETE